MLVIKSTIKKTILKGAILILIFSIFLEVSKVIDFLIFLGLSFSLLLAYALYKKIYTYEIDDNNIKIKSPFEKKIIPYNSIEDYFTSVGFLAKKFNCGSIYLILKNNKVEILKDIPNPEKIEEEITKFITNKNN
ncbi:PH domain-containing protein [Acidianus manzaensis]|uniref:YdbS-like PH domain-containing protein n=1 Tax=Acidianus manzaensis TaxID=282676 RepID=A0A1W6JYU0_9CREN|nr:PH domain-containing protein [Acidianus manzaensis]ARM75428.1 hypothetical protein B6F84_04885 [Acidianus manzaensis]